MAVQWSAGVGGHVDLAAGGAEAFHEIVNGLVGYVVRVQPNHKRFAVGVWVLCCKLAINCDFHAIIKPMLNTSKLPLNFMQSPRPLFDKNEYECPVGRLLGNEINCHRISRHYEGIGIPKAMSYRLTLLFSILGALCVLCG